MMGGNLTAGGRGQGAWGRGQEVAANEVSR